MRFLLRLKALCVALFTHLYIHTCHDKIGGVLNLKETESRRGGGPSSVNRQVPRVTQRDSEFLTGTEPPRLLALHPDT